ncbi:glycoside hydrolase domain-containing protein [Neobacillus cucumis]|uniref:glycoside hydrolase domain-containing protein n=1 Tax=Neobacillus cucumis TaxID=1740721 RepID=UPI002E211A3C|nr:DUF1906 domain-containing protein [Neobacillus cucumis]
MNKRQWVWSIVLCAILVFPLLLVFFHHNNTQIQHDSPKIAQEVSAKPVTNSSKKPSTSEKLASEERPSTSGKPAANNKPATNEKPTYVWGVDTASSVDQAFLQCVKNNYGAPSVLGRYLESKGDVSVGLTKEEIDLLHKQGIKILPIFNHFTNAVGYDKGVAEAKEAIAYAQKIGIPKGVAIFADIEPGYPVDEAFIRGWVDTLANSPYKPGIYGIFTPEGKISAAYLAAVSKSKIVQEQTIIWSSNPDPGVSTKNKSPGFNPGAPKNIHVSIWQYGIDGGTCNIDTNLIESTSLDHLW